MNNRDSEVISIVRFPLAFMVVMLHSYVAVRGFHILHVDYTALTGTDVYSIVGITFSHVLTQVAVPMFFFISGYLFYIGLKEWDSKRFVDKFKRRVKTLLIPYLVWNTVYALIFVGIILITFVIYGKPLDRIETWFREIGGFWGIFWSNQTTAVVKDDLFGFASFKSYPLLMPMWFIRDLMVTVLLSPLLWWMLKKISYWILILLVLMWATGMAMPVPGLSFSALFFFTLGGAFSLKGKSFMDVSLRINKWLLVVIVIGLTLASIYFDGRSTHEGQLLLSLWILFALPSSFRIAAWSMKTFPEFTRRLSEWSASSYFIFAFHGVIISYVYNALWKLMGVVTDDGMMDAMYMNNHAINGIVAYLLTPMITVALSVIFYGLVCKLFKNWSWLFTGK